MARRGLELDAAAGRICGVVPPGCGHPLSDIAKDRWPCTQLLSRETKDCSRNRAVVCPNAISVWRDRLFPTRRGMGAATLYVTLAERDEMRVQDFGMAPGAYDWVSRARCVQRTGAVTANRHIQRTDFESATLARQQLPGDLSCTAFPQSKSTRWKTRSILP